MDVFQRSLITIIATIFGCAGLSSVFAAANDSQPATPETPATPVTTAFVEKGSYVRPFLLTGTATAQMHVELAAMVAGFVEKVWVYEGDHVKKDQRLALLRLRPFQLDVQKHRAKADAIAARLNKMLAGNRSENIAISRANYEKALVSEELASDSHNRNTALLKKNMVSKDAFDSALERWKISVADVAVKKATYDLAAAGERKEEIAAVRAELAEQKANVAIAEDRLQRATIHAPFAGVITAKRTEIGAWAEEGGTLFDIENTDVIWIRMLIPESYFHKLKLKNELAVTFDSFPDIQYSGLVIRKIPKADGRSRSFPVIVEIDNKHGRLASGMLARIVFTPPHNDQQTMIVPRDAIIPRGGKNALFKVIWQGDKPTSQEISITTGRYFGQAVEVIGEIQAGDRIVIRGNERLHSGQTLLLDRFITKQEDGHAAVTTRIKELIQQ